jgi:hypothetical protein
MENSTENLTNKKRYHITVGKSNTTVKRTDSLEIASEKLKELENLNELEFAITDNQEGKTQLYSKESHQKNYRVTTATIEKKA